jgi:hypothetical protein
MKNSPGSGGTGLGGSVDDERSHKNHPASRDETIDNIRASHEGFDLLVAQDSLAM